MTNKWYRAVVVLLFLSLMYVVVGLTSPNQSAETDMGALSGAVHLPVLALNSLIYVVMLYRFATRPQHYLRGIARMGSLVPLLAVCLLSTLWASDHLLSLRHVIALMVTTLIAIMVGTDFELPDILRMFSLASFIHIFLVGCLLVVSRHSLYSPDDPISLKGLTTHKNVFGFEMALAVLAFAMVPFRRAPFLRWPLTAVALTLLILSRSSGSMVATVGAFSVLPFLFAMRFRGVQRIPLMLLSSLGAVAFGVFIFANQAMLPYLFSKDATLTGRTQLWELVRVAIGQHPLLGYGFDSFWQGMHGDSLNIIVSVGWLVPTAHNGYYDFLLGVGFVGVACFLPAFFQMIVRSLRYLDTERSSARLFPIAFLAFWLIYNLNESALLTRSGMPLLLFVAMSVSMVMHQRFTVPYGRVAVGYPDDLHYVGTKLPV
jgi:exopolysaccharide production protein ExoQ